MSYIKLTHKKHGKYFLKNTSRQIKKQLIKFNIYIYEKFMSFKIEKN